MSLNIITLFKKREPRSEIRKCLKSFVFKDESTTTKKEKVIHFHYLKPPSYLINNNHNLISHSVPR